MKRILRISTAALFGATMLASPALAQVEADADLEAGTQLEADNPSNAASRTGTEGAAELEIDPGTTAAVGADFDSAVELMGDANAATEIASMTDVGEVRLIRLSTLDNSDETRIDQAMAQSDAEIQQLHAAIQANPAVASQIEAEGAVATDVVAADVAADGSLIVYTR